MCQSIATPILPSSCSTNKEELKCLLVKAVWSGCSWFGPLQLHWKDFVNGRGRYQLQGDTAGVVVIRTAVVEPLTCNSHSLLLALQATQQTTSQKEGTDSCSGSWGTPAPVAIQQVPCRQCIQGPQRRTWWINFKGVSLQNSFSPKENHQVRAPDTTRPDDDADLGLLDPGGHRNYRLPATWTEETRRRMPRSFLVKKSKSERTSNSAVDLDDVYYSFTPSPVSPISVSTEAISVSAVTPYTPTLLPLTVSTGRLQSFFRLSLSLLPKSRNIR